MAPNLISAVVLLLCAAGCVRRDGRNSDCRWPAETASRPADARHLSADAEFAEDLAIRYADTHYGLRTPYYVSAEAYDAARDRCMTALLEQAAKEHGIPTADVAASLGRNRAGIDIAVNLPFALLYGFLAAAVARMMWRRYPPAEHGWIPGAIMALFLSLVFAGGCTMFGELWSWVVETYRIGNDHMSYRAQRLPWVRHRPGLFAGALFVFWVAATARARKMRTDQSMPADRSLISYRQNGRADAARGDGLAPGTYWLVGSNRAGVRKPLFCSKFPVTPSFGHNFLSTAQLPVSRRCTGSPTRTFHKGISR